MIMLERTVRVVIMALLGAMTLLVGLQVVLRYLFSMPLSWGEEVTRYMFVYLIFIGGASGIHYGTHVSIDVLVRRTGAAGKVIDRLAKVVVGAFLVFLIWFGTQLALQTMNQKSPALGMPIGYAYFAIPIGALLGLVFLVGKKRELQEELPL